MPTTADIHHSPGIPVTFSLSSDLYTMPQAPLPVREKCIESADSFQFRGQSLGDAVGQTVTVVLDTETAFDWGYTQEAQTQPLEVLFFSRALLNLKDRLVEKEVDQDVWRKFLVSVGQPCVHEGRRDWLRGRYTLRDERAVDDFLLDNSFLVDLLCTVAVKLEEHLLECELFLEVISYPDSVDDKQLVVSVRADMSDEDTDDALDRFEDDWWLDNLHRAQGKVCIVLEF